MFSLQDVQDARNRTAPYIRRTPFIRNHTLSEQLGTNVYLKYELFQKTGSFKPRGAFNQVLCLTPAQKERGAVAVSGGNFAQGAAYAGQVLGVPMLICMPEYTPENYIQATKSYGAKVELVTGIPEAFDLAHAYQQQGLAALHPYDHPNQMAGNGSLGLELLEDLPEMSDVFISIGGGGLIAGMMLAIKSIKPQVRIWGVETEGSDTMGQALQAGKVVQIKPVSLAKTLGAPHIAEDALILAQRYLEGYILVSDREAFLAELFLLERAKVLTELAASCTLAALRRLEGFFTDKDHVVLLLCGGNVSLDSLMDYHQRFANRPLT
jgi:threonine dehydratase